MRGKRKLKKLLPRMVLPAICLMVFLSSGCSRTSVYVLDQAELMKVAKGDKVDIKFDGYVFSDRAIQRVMNAKVDDIKKD